MMFLQSVRNLVEIMANVLNLESSQVKFLSIQLLKQVNGMIIYMKVTLNVMMMKVAHAVQQAVVLAVIITTNLSMN